MMIRLKSAIPTSRICNEFDRLFGDLVNGYGTFQGNMTTTPALNVWQDETNVLVEAELPGVAMDNLEVLVLGNELTIKGQRRDYDEDNSFLRQECPTGEFVRVLTLPVEIEADAVSASLNNGVLKIKLPKAKKALPRTIEVQS